MRKLLPVLLILVFFLACEPPDEREFEPRPNVFALMKGSDSLIQQVIWVDQSYDIKDSLEHFGVIDASVIIFSEYDTFVFVDTYRVADTVFYCYEGKYVRDIMFNDTTLYHLEVALPWDDTVTAEAYMPSPIQISAPADSDTVSISAEPYDPHVITWNSCKNTELYVIYCVPDVDDSLYKNYPNFLFFPSFTNDTSYTFFLQRMLAPWIYDKYYVLRIMAVSPEYAAYMGFFGPGEVYSNLSAGYGMFGGIAEDSVRVYIVE